MASVLDKHSQWSHNSQLYMLISTKLMILQSLRFPKDKFLTSPRATNTTGTVSLDTGQSMYLCADM